jgi:MFS family permease
MTKTRFLWWLLFLSVCGSICAGVSQIAITLYAVSLGATSAQLGFIKGLSGIGVFLIVLPMGFLVDHFGAKKIFILGGLIDACVYSAMPFAHTPQNLMLAMAILGFFSSFRSVALNTVFLDKLEIFGSEKAGWNKAAYSVGLAFVGPLLGGYLVKYINYSWTFIFVSALLVVSVVTAVFLLERTQTPKNLEAFSLGEVFRQLQGLFKNKRFLEISGIDALTTALFSCFTVFAVVMALRNFGLSRETAALLVSLEGISYIVALFFLGPVLKLIGYRQTYFFGIFPDFVFWRRLPMLSGFGRRRLCWDLALASWDWSMFPKSALWPEKKAGWPQSITYSFISESLSGQPWVEAWRMFLVCRRFFGRLYRYL